MVPAMVDLIITNGGTAVELLQETGRAPTILPWNDVLHEGPIRGTLLADCTPDRVDYLAHRFRLPREKVAGEFAARDALVCRHADFPAIELWFEHDLYDQLQLLQILSFFADEGRTAGLALVQADDYLGAQSAETILRFADRTRAVDQTDLTIAAEMWAALANPTPEAVAARLGQGDDRFPFLGAALTRFLEELPAAQSGLNRTEETTLTAIANGSGKPLRLFGEVTGQEEALFMGDWSFFCMLDDLASCDEPLIAGLAPPGAREEELERLRDATLVLTDAGEVVLEGGADHVALNRIDRWWAGTHLVGPSVWRYDRNQKTLVAPTRSDA